MISRLLAIAIARVYVWLKTLQSKTGEELDRILEEEEGPEVNDKRDDGDNVRWL